MKELFEGVRRWASLNEEQLLAEGRLQDAKKKFPNVDADWIDRIADRDPSGNNKYLMWAVKQFAKITEPWMKNAPSEPGQRWADSDAQAIYNAYMTIVDAVDKFHNNSQRLKNRDINAYKTIDDVVSAVRKLGLTQKQKRRKKREQAKEGSEVIDESDDFWMIRPNTTESSCYYGQGTKWCISATQSKNYFKEYERQGKTFYMLMLKNLDDDDTGKKIALVYGRDVSPDYDAEPEEIYNAEDFVYNTEDFYDKVVENFIAAHFADYEKIKKEYDDFAAEHDEETLTDNVRKVAKELMDAGTPYDSDIDEQDFEDPDDSDDYWSLAESMEQSFRSAMYNIFYQAASHAEYNPSGPSVEDYEEMVAEANLAHISVSIDEYMEGQLWWEGTMAFDFPEDVKFSKDEDGDETDFTYWEDEIKQIFEEASDDNYVYPDQVEIAGENLISFTFRQSNDYGDNTDFESWLVNIEEIDGKYDDILESAVELLEQSEIVEDEDAEEKNEMVRNLRNMKNFDVSINRGKLVFEQKSEYEMNLPLTRTLGIPQLKRVPARGPGEKLAKSPDRDQYIKDALRILQSNMAKHQYLYSAFYLTYDTAIEQYMDSRAKQGDLPLGIKEKPEKESLQESSQVKTNMGPSRDRTTLDFVDFGLSLDNGGELYASIRFDKVLHDHIYGMKYFLWLDKNLDAFYEVMANTILKEAKEIYDGYMRREPERFEPKEVSENVSYGRLCENWKSWLND